MDADRLLSDWAEVTGRARRPAQAPTDPGLRPLDPLVRLAGVAAMAVVLVVVAAWVLPRPADRQVGSSEPVDARSLVGLVAPPIDRPGLDGAVVGLAPFAGRPIVVSFTASWCVPCAGQAAVLAGAHDPEGRSGPAVVSVVVQDDPTAAARFGADRVVTWPVALDPDGGVFASYGGFGLPMTVFIDPTGEVASLSFGPLDASSLATHLAAITAVASPSARPSVVDCPTTRENGTPWPMTGDARGTYGADGLVMRVQPDGVLRIGDAQVDADGVLWEKLGVWREASAAGKLALTGRRLDGPSAPMLAQIPDGYGDTGLQIAGVGFPTEGCWEITATAGTARMVVVTRVVRRLAGEPAVPPVTLETCPVTTPNGAHTTAWPASALDHGHHGLFTVLWPDGTVVVQPDQVDADGTLWMKFVFQRESGALAPLTVVGQRLDAADPTAAEATMRAVIPDGYGTSGIQATSLGFPTPGCWEVTAKAGPAILSFGIRVIAG